MRSAGGTSDDLVRLITGAASGTVLLLAGAGQGAATAAGLRAAGLRVARRVAYATRPVARMPPAVLELLAGHDLHGIVFMSAATACGFVRLLPAQNADGLHGVVAACISERTAAVVRHLPWGRLRVPLRPNLVDTLALL